MQASDMFKIVLITQNDPFYLGKSIKHLIQNLPESTRIVGCVLLEVSPFGGKESFRRKILKTWQIFGSRFFLNYGFEYVLAKFKPSQKIRYILRREGIPIIKLQRSINNQDSLALINNYKPDLLVSIAGNQIFRRPLIELAPKGCINLHTSLLPKYRGLMPTFWVLKNGEEETGVSVFFVDEGIDSGPIIVQKKVKITRRSQKELIKETKRLGMEAICEAVAEIKSGELTLMDNPDNKKTYYSFPKRQDVKEFLANGNKFY